MGLFLFEQIVHTVRGRYLVAPEEEVLLFGVQFSFHLKKDSDEKIIFRSTVSESDFVPREDVQPRRREEPDDVGGGLLPRVVQNMDEDGPVGVGSLAEDLDLVDQVFEKGARFEH